MRKSEILFGFLQQEFFQSIADGVIILTLIGWRINLLCLFKFFLFLFLA